MNDEVELESRFCGNELCERFGEVAAVDGASRRRHLYVTEQGNRFYFCDRCHYAVWLARDARNPRA